MPTRAEQITALETALASGELSVRYGETSVTYRAVSEIERALAYLRALVAEESGKPAVRTTVGAFFRD